MRRVDPLASIAIVGIVAIVAAATLQAQQTLQPAQTRQPPQTLPTSTALTPVPRLLWFSSTFRPADNLPVAPVENVTVTVYRDRDGGDALWRETQNVTMDADGRYNILMGSTFPDGLPLELFTSGEPRWIGITVNRSGEVEQPRVHQASVPYALKAADADTLGGHPASAYRLVETVSSSSPGTPEVSANASKDSTNAVLPKTAGTTGYLGMFTDSANLGNSVLLQSGSFIGLGTAPKDAFHVAFNNGTGTQTGFAVQNLSGAAGAYSGMLFYDQNGALGQFQGFNNSTHEYRINNVASSGKINFMIGSSSKFLVANNGNIGLGISTPAARFHVVGTQPAEVGYCNNGTDASDGMRIIAAKGGNTSSPFCLNGSRGGVGGSIRIQSGDGGDATWYENEGGGKAGDVSIVAGKGGDTSDNTAQRSGGNGGNVLIQPGAAGRSPYNFPFGWGSPGNVLLAGTGGAVGIGTTVPQQMLSVNGGMNVDQGDFGSYLTFGSGSGEGITSKRSVGGNQWGLDFVTGGAVRLSIANNGDVNVVGKLTKGSGAFKIDHPLDPENKYLYHSFVESADMMNIYNGNVVLDSNGEATIALPEWFEALNGDFRYQLTAIGKASPGLYVAEKVAHNHFKIGGGTPNAEVSWQVTGIRHDTFANAHRIPVEEEKTGAERGRYLYPR